MNREKLENLIKDFSLENLNEFLYEANLDKDKEDLSFLNNEDIFSDVQKLGEIETEDKKNIIVAAAKVKNDLSERSSRKKQYDLGKKILESHDGCKAGIFVFYDKQGSFRFSLIYPTYSGTKRVLNSFKRYTYFVSKEQTNKTFLSQIGEGDFLTLEKIKDAFSVEKVTKEFFGKYKELFEELVEEFNNNQTFKNEADIHNINTENFAKKLLGQIVFLYFLQKKCWLGATKDKSLKQGDKDFLQNLFDKKYREYNNFFNDILEHLFYGALNKKSEKAGTFYRDYFKCQIPFLNGGLFDSEYEWEESKIYLDDKIFKKILEVFNRYNFTVDENSPMDQEIAIDPEMLGKVFENLLSENLRKGKGTYYTPREIVHYMCQESLINYLTSTISAPSSVIPASANVIPASHHVIPAEAGIQSPAPKQEDITTLIKHNGTDNSQIPKIISKNAKLIDEKLASIKVCDPACGSGAFLVGMLQEIIKARQILQPLLNKKTSEYDLKKETIQNCIYGVDIDTGAIEIAKLRLWLSLVVDYELEEIEPLPNLDYKIMQGNSLLEEFEGIKFYSEENKTLFKDKEREEKTEELRKKKLKYFSESDGDKKDRLKLEISNLIDWFVGSALEQEKNRLKTFRKNEEEKSKQIVNKKDRKNFYNQWSSKFSKEGKIDELLEKIHDPKTEKPFFLWRLNFMEVFEDGGFDVVIANPPYVSVKGISVDDKKLFSKMFETGQGRFNLFTLFLEKGNKMLKTNGVLTFILPDGLYSNVEYQYIRKYLLENTTILFINLFSSKIFDAAVDTSIISTINNKNISREFSVIRDIKEKIVTLNQKIFKELPFCLFAVNIDDKSKEIIFRILKNKDDKINDILEIQQGIIYSGQPKEKVFDDKKKNVKYKKVLDGRDILKWFVNWGDKRENKYICYTNKLHRAREERIFLAKEKILLPRKSTKICCAYDNKQYYCLNTAYICLLKNNSYKLKFIIAILNSKLINYFYDKLFFGWQITIPALNSISIPKISLAKQKPFIKLVDQILKKKKNDPKADTTKLEKKIDEMVYKLYNLTDEEIKIMEKNK